MWPVRILWSDGRLAGGQLKLVQNILAFIFSIQSKLLAKELEMLKEAKLNSERECEQAEGNQQQLQKLLKQKDWQLQDVTALKDAKYAKQNCVKFVLWSQL